jgi:hypothetical protein
MNKLNAFKAGIAAIALTSAGASAEVIYFNNFDGGTMSGVGTARQVDQYVASNNNNDGWGIHSFAQANQLLDNAAISGNRVGHYNGFYNANERSIFSFSIDATGFDLTKLSFDFRSILRDYGNPDRDGASLVAYTGTFNETTLGNNSYQLLSTNNGEFVYENVDPNSQLDEAQFGTPNTGPFTGFANDVNNEGTAMFDLTGLGFSNEIVNFRLAFGSTDSYNSDGIVFDNFKLEGSDCTGPGGSCQMGGGSVPEPASLALAMIGLAGIYGARKKRII